MKATELSRNPVSDLSSKGRNTQAMNAISREEFNARIETIEARMDARVEGVSAKIDAYISVQTERDKRYDLISLDMQRIAKGAEEAARQGATVKANVWAATAVQLLGLVAIVVGAYYANQANMYVAIQTKLAAVQAGKDIRVPKQLLLPSLTPPQ
ncbi:hypothetical protein SAMN04488483_0351 [Pseudomonas helmanticensis]|uniref:Uncharacterized protein n=1 Tax=Pseudomonas helmanticensis TaxID=1471381 RepID=A0ACD2TZV1_9PSED|nr:hypothetical protein [Pseudomonas helmanticensis]SMQ22472.1 hypothetical protein SAMN04488483_0351 [Pseudomonas helmanticensis]